MTHRTPNFQSTPTRRTPIYESTRNPNHINFTAETINEYREKFSEIIAAHGIPALYSRMLKRISKKDMVRRYVRVVKYFLTPEEKSNGFSEWSLQISEGGSYTLLQITEWTSPDVKDIKDISLYLSTSESTSA